MNGAPRSLTELPFARAEPRALLNLHPGQGGHRRTAPEHDYAGFGWTEVDALVLSSDDGQRRIVGPALVLALHTADDPPTRPPSQPDALELLFELDGDEDEPLVVLAPFDRFMSAWLPHLPRSAPHVVLALCNPQSITLPPIPSLGSRSLHYAHGDVSSWLDVDDDPATTQIRLHARAWVQR